MSKIPIDYPRTLGYVKTLVREYSFYNLPSFKRVLPAHNITKHKRISSHLSPYPSAPNLVVDMIGINCYQSGNLGEEANCIHLVQTSCCMHPNWEVWVGRYTDFESNSKFDFDMAQGILKVNTVCITVGKCDNWSRKNRVFYILSSGSGKMSSLYLCKGRMGNQSKIALWLGPWSHIFHYNSLTGNVQNYIDQK